MGHPWQSIVDSSNQATDGITMDTNTVDDDGMLQCIRRSRRRVWSESCWYSKVGWKSWYQSTRNSMQKIQATVENKYGQYWDNRRPKFFMYWWLLGWLSDGESHRYTTWVSGLIPDQIFWDERHFRGLGQNKYPSKYWYEASKAASHCWLQQITFWAVKMGAPLKF